MATKMQLMVEGFLRNFTNRIAKSRYGFLFM